MSRSSYQGNSDTDRTAEAIRIKPDYANAYHNRGTAHRKLGDDVKAAADFAKVRVVLERQEKGMLDP